MNGAVQETHSSVVPAQFLFTQERAQKISQQQRKDICLFLETMAVLDWMAGGRTECSALFLSIDPERPAKIRLFANSFCIGKKTDSKEYRWDVYRTMKRPFSCTLKESLLPRICSLQNNSTAWKLFLEHVKDAFPVPSKDFLPYMQAVKRRIHLLADFLAAEMPIECLFSSK